MEDSRKKKFRSEGFAWLSSEARGERDWPQLTS
jgi:hypothetical protein